jgi:hypothetical protein
MADYKSNSQVASHKLRGFFTPSGAEILLLAIISSILLAALNAGSAIQKLSNNYIGSPDHLKANFSTLSSSFNSSFSTALGGRLGQILLWAFIGAITYIGLWIIKNIFYSFENDVIADHYLHPSSFSRAGYWGSSFSVKIFFFALALISAAYVFVAVRAVLPAAAALAGSAVDNFHASTSPFYILSALIGLVVVLYIGKLLFKLLAHLWKLL